MTKTSPFRAAGTAEQCQAQLETLARRIGEPGLGRIEDCLVVALASRETSRRMWVEIALREVRKLQAFKARAVGNA